jgi:hypothetical protein
MSSMVTMGDFRISSDLAVDVSLVIRVNGKNFVFGKFCVLLKRFRIS